jgi:hypothetical protein
MPYLRLTLDAYSMMDLKARCICVEASGNQVAGEAPAMYTYIASAVGSISRVKPASNFQWPNLISNLPERLPEPLEFEVFRQYSVRPCVLMISDQSPLRA